MASPSGIGTTILYNSPFMQNPSVVRIGRRRRRSRNKSKFLQRLRTAFLLLCFVALLATVGMVAGAVGTYQALAADMPDLDDYRSAELAQTSLVYDANGKVVDQLYGVQNRFVVPLEGVDPTLRQAIISIEDHRFYEHRGLDFEAIGRAAVENVAEPLHPGGRLHVDPAAHKEHLHRPATALHPELRAEVRRGLARLAVREGTLQARDPGAVPEHRVLRRQRLRRRGRRQDLLQQGCRRTSRSPSPRFWPGSSTSPASTTRSSTPRAPKERRNVVLDRMLEYGHITKKEHDRAVASEVVAEPRQGRVPERQRVLPQRRPQGDSRGVRRRHGLRGGTQDLHHPRPRPAGDGERGRRLHREPGGWRPFGLPGLDRPVDGRGQGDGRRLGLRRRSSSTSRPRPTGRRAARSSPSSTPRPCTRGSRPRPCTSPNT